MRWSHGFFWVACLWAAGCQSPPAATDPFLRPRVPPPAPGDVMPMQQAPGYVPPPPGSLGTAPSATPPPSFTPAPPTAPPPNYAPSVPNYSAPAPPAYTPPAAGGYTPPSSATPGYAPPPGTPNYAPPTGTPSYQAPTSGAPYNNSAPGGNSLYNRQGWLKPPEFDRRRAPDPPRVAIDRGGPPGSYRNAPPGLLPPESSLEPPRQLSATASTAGANPPSGVVPVTWSSSTGNASGTPRASPPSPGGVTRANRADFVDDRAGAGHADGPSPVVRSTSGTGPADHGATYGYDSSYRWLQGRLEYSPATRQWKLRYVPIDGQTDQYGGSVVLADAAALAGYRDGEFVAVKGAVVGQGPTQAGFAPLYRVTDIQRLAD